MQAAVCITESVACAAVRSSLQELSWDWARPGQLPVECQMIALLKYNVDVTVGR